MEATSNEISNVLGTLNKDLEAARKSRMMSLVIGAVSTVIVFVVMMTFVGTLKQEITPSNLADVAAYSTRNMIKEARPVVEDTFKKNVPLFLRELRMYLVNDLVPSLRKEIQAEMTKMVDETFATSSVAFTAAAKEVVGLVQPMAKETMPQPDLVASLIVREFEKEKKKRYADRPEETLGQQFAESKRMLTALNDKLTLLTSKKRHSRQEQMELKFLRAWASLLTRGEGAP